MRPARRLAAEVVSLAAAALGLPARLRRRRRRRGDFRVFILEYHDVAADGTEREGVIAAERFRRHLRWLKRHYRPATLASVGELLATREPWTEDRVVVTFDDGYAGNHAGAWPALRDESVPATIFLATDFLDGSDLWFDTAWRSLEAARRAGLPAATRRGLARTLGVAPDAIRLGQPARLIRRLKYSPPPVRLRAVEILGDADLPRAPAARPLAWDQVREMQAGDVEMGCHTASHPILSTLDRAEQSAEIRRARDRIAIETGTVPRSFAFPNGAAGDFDDATVELLRAAGFRRACTSIRGANRPGCDPLQLRRIGVGSDADHVLAARLAGLFDAGLRRWGAGRRHRPGVDTPAAVEP